MSAPECCLAVGNTAPTFDEAAGASQQKTVGCLLDVVVATQAQPLLTLRSIAGKHPAPRGQTSSQPC